MKLALIPAGEFLMGSPNGDKDAANDQNSRSTACGSPRLSTWAPTR